MCVCVYVYVDDVYMRIDPSVFRSSMWSYWMRKKRAREKTHVGYELTLRACFVVVVVVVVNE